jgi:UDP-N-acetylmuramate dehydrogenase
MQSRAALASLGELTLDAPLASLSTYRLGGRARAVIEPTSLATLSKARAQLHAGGWTEVLLGDGSNVLFDDAGLDGFAVRIGSALGAVRREGNVVIAEAGVAMARLARWTVKQGLAGLEDLAGVPGRLGGMVVMNGGCFRQKIGERVAAVTAVDRDGTLREFSGAECCFDYRHSRFLDEPGRWAIASVRLRLGAESPAVLAGRMLEILRERRARFPRYRLEPNCGSVFKNLPEMHAAFGPPGRVVEETGCKGWREGGAMVSRQHANFITAGPGATTADVLRLIDRVRTAVRQRTGIDMQCEVRHVGCDGTIRPAHEAPIPAGR